MSERRKDEERRQRLRAMKRRQTLLIVTFFVTIIVLVVVIVISNKSAEKKEDKVSEETEVLVLLEEPDTEEEILSEEESESSTEEETETTVPETEPVESVTEAPVETTPETVAETVPETAPPVQAFENPNEQTDRFYIPSWITQDFLTPSKYNRPYEALYDVNNVVIHYVGNPGSTAKGNRDYFEELSNPAVNPTGHGASSHFVVGLDGEVIQCIPAKEVAFANYPRNYDTISIEVCHPDAGGKFTDVTYSSVVRLSAYILEELNLTADALIRHHDVTGKMCPMYYVEHEDAWIQFKEDVRAYMAAHPDIENEMP